MSSPQNLLIEAGGAIATITINRPKVLNALDAATIGELIAAFSALPTGTRCVILTGAGEKAFVAGADIAAMADLDAGAAEAFAARGHELARIMESLAAPIIAAVNGFALGGGLELLLACDFALAAQNAKVGLPEASLGLIPGFGGTQRLARRVGLGPARQLVYSGDLITADEALRLGIVNAVTPSADLLPAVRTVAEKIASRAPLAVAAAKRVMNAGADVTLAEGLALEQEAFAGLFSSSDAREGMKAFLAKRPPNFQGR